MVRGFNKKKNIRRGIPNRINRVFRNCRGVFRFNEAALK